MWKELNNREPAHTVEKQNKDYACMQLNKKQ